MTSEAQPAYTTHTVRSIAAGILADGAFDRCPVLADALEDAGYEGNAVHDLRRGPEADPLYVRHCTETLIRILSESEPDGLDEMLRSYTGTALWASNDESDDTGGEPMDANYGREDIDADSLAAMRRDCAAFLAVCGEDIDGAYDEAGHDFWLTRNHHGAGFWDGDWDRIGGGEDREDMATRLTDVSHRFGECHLYVGDDGSIYHTRG